MKKYKVHILWVIVALIALVGGIYWGKSMVPARGAGGFGGAASGTRGAFAGRGGAAGAGGGFVAGTISAVNPDSLTLQLPNGNSEVVFYSSSTQVVIPQTTSISSVQTGASVMVGGTQNSDGSMTATTIQVRNGNTPGGPGSGATSGGGGQPSGQY